MTLLKPAALLLTGGAALLGLHSLAGLSAAGTDLDAFVAQVALRLAPVVLALATLTFIALSRPVRSHASARRPLTGKPAEAELRTAPAAGSAL